MDIRNFVYYKITGNVGTNSFTKNQGCGSGRIRIHLGPWIQMYKMKVKKQSLTNQNPFFFLHMKLYFMSEPKDIIAEILLMRANLKGLGSD